MSLAEYTIGFAYFAGTLTAVTLAAWLITRRKYASLEGTPRVLCLALLVVTGLIGVHMIAGILAVLTRTSVLVLAAGACAVVWLWSRREQKETPSEEPSTSDAEMSDVPVATALAAATVAGIVVYILGFVVLTRNNVITDIDSVSFHLPRVARWIQTGSFWDVKASWAPGWAFGNYPNNGNVVQLAFVLPWNNDALVRFIQVPLLALTGLSVYAIARELRAPRSTAAVFAAVPCVMPTTLRELQSAHTDLLLFATFSIGVLFLLRSLRSGSRSELVLAGLGLGLAFGTKWYGVTYVLVVLVVWGVSSLVARHPLRRVIGQGAVLSGVVFASGGFWLVRNLIQSGSPIFPAKVSLAGVTIFDAPPSLIVERFGFSIAHYFGQPGIVRRSIVPQLTRSFGLGGLLLCVALVGAAAVIVRRAGRPLRPERSRVLTLISAGVLILIAYTFTPFTALGREGHPDLVVSAARYAVPGLLLAAAAGAWAAGTIGGLWRAGTVAVAIVGILDGLRRVGALGRTDFRITARLVAYGIGASVALALVVFVIAGIARRRDLPPASRAIAAIAAFVVLTTAGVAAGYRQQRAYNGARYGAEDPVYAWIDARAPSGHRVGLVGSFGTRTAAPPLPAHGPRLRNEVVYVGPILRGLLADYRAEGSFVAALDRGRFDLLVIGLGDPPRPQAPQEIWAKSAGFVEVVRSRRLVLLARSLRAR